MKLTVDRPLSALAFVAQKYPVSTSLFTMVAGVFAMWGAAGFFSVPFGTWPDSFGDAIFLQLMSKSALIGSGFFKLPYLAFPDGMDFSYFPTFDFTQFAILKACASFLHNPAEMWTAFHMAASALGFCTSFVLFLCLTGKPLQAALLAFGSCFFAYVIRMTGHNFLYADYAVALGVLLILILFAKDSLVYATSRNLRFIQIYILPLICLFFITFSGIYYTFFFLAISTYVYLTKLVFGDLKQWKPGLLFIVGSVALFLVGAFLAYPNVFTDPEIFSPRRSAYEQPGAALRVSDALLEYGRNIYNGTMPFNPRPVRDYATWRTKTEGFDAFSGPFVTIFALLAPFLFPLLSKGVVKDWVERQPRMKDAIWVSAASIFLIILFALPYSYGFLFSQIVTPAIRSQNRFSPFMNLFAMILLYAFFYITMKARTLPIVIALTIILALNGLGRYGYWRNYYANLPQSSVDNRISAEEVAKRIEPSSNSMVLQLPYANFPEVPDIGKFQPYQHLLLPVVFPAATELQMPRWSYGSFSAQMASKLGHLYIGEPLVTGWDNNAACMGYTDMVIEKRAYDQLPLPDLTAWKLVYEDPIRQLWKRTASTAALHCASSLSLDFKTRDDTYLLLGEDRIWHVDETGGYLKQKSGRIALPLYGLMGQDACIQIDAKLTKRSDRSSGNPNLYVRLGSNEAVWNMNVDGAQQVMKAKLTRHDWDHGIPILTVSQISEQMSWIDWAIARWKVHDRLLGFQGLSAKQIPCD